MNRQLATLAVLLTLIATPALADNSSLPEGVVLVLIDDNRYGDIDCLHLIDPETPHDDSLCRESLRLTNFHVGELIPPHPPRQAMAIEGKKDDGARKERPVRAEKNITLLVNRRGISLATRQPTDNVD